MRDVINKTEDGESLETMQRVHAALSDILSDEVLLHGPPEDSHSTAGWLGATLLWRVLYALHPTPLPILKRRSELEGDPPRPVSKLFADPNCMTPIDVPASLESASDHPAAVMLDALHASADRTRWLSFAVDVGGVALGSQEVSYVSVSAGIVQHADPRRATRTEVTYGLTAWAKGDTHPRPVAGIMLEHYLGRDEVTVTRRGLFAGDSPAPALPSADMLLGLLPGQQDVIDRQALAGEVIRAAAPPITAPPAI